ncbi:MAG TPA: Holliday junction ATP-dependent DNA helicase RuvA [Candidatus Dojkabacteria bacterium]|nr:Holliday junction ATP-dependent DNA helicase RuvA [Candidatus Dojkabacteria bacterium]HRO65645.1 Holliday junction ATP-dependent DNA helicase RuvA [Candidatus Dojkabacteria bacterium]HRP36225.1 Holliday junction ATP-dependent DNA helicase RuvA [Candidatus Dojkabacteria bacterium]HRP51593.1 Holliday junction ATP-dependent DNA helicase RuvA [Candidatus Dojkabacteria bacterium]
MFAKLKGTISDIFSDFIILDVGDVGYRVETIQNEFLVGEEKSFFIYTHVRENEIRLFGLDTKNQYSLFVDLIGISGVGPKLAQNILKQIPYESIMSAIADKNIDTLLVKGVGKKTAQRIIIDMTSKLEKYTWEGFTSQNNLSQEFRSQAQQALQNLGLSKDEIRDIIKEYGVNHTEEKLELLVKFALKFINK